jgi:hypothetical protein
MPEDMGKEIDSLITGAGREFQEVKTFDRLDDPIRQKSNNIDGIARWVRDRAIKVDKAFSGSGGSESPISSSNTTDLIEEHVDPDWHEVPDAPKPWLFEDDSELEGLPSEVILALRYAQRLDGRAGRLVSESLSRINHQIDEAVLTGSVDPERVDRYLKEINARVEDLERERRPPVEVSSRPEATSDIITPLAETLREGQTRMAEAVEKLGVRLEEGQERFREVTEKAQVEGRENINALMDQMSQALEASRAASPSSQISTESAYAGTLMDLFGEDPKQSREIWAQAEYRQNFPLRFNPGQEPKFFKQLGYEGRALMEARWRLATATYAAKKLSGNAEKYVLENPELPLITNEEMKRLYEMPGVRQGLEWYADFVCNNKTIEVTRRGRRVPITIWECRNDSEFQQIRKAMRDEALVALSGDGDVKTNFGGGVEEELDKYEADAVAWNLIKVTNLLESMDSRYSRSGARHGDISGDLLSDDVRALLHPQEKWEAKISKNPPESWGILSGWGETQVGRVKHEAKVGGKDRVVFSVARKLSDYWTYTEELGTGGGRTITIMAPECFPTTIAGSFWEHCGQDGENLLDKLLSKEKIDWDEVSGGWNPYLFVTLLQSVKVFKYWNPGVGIAYNKPGHATAFAGDLSGAINRSGMNRRLSDKELHNLKVWAVYGGTGVNKIMSRLPEPAWSGTQKAILETAFREPHIGYLAKGKGFLGMGGEKLDLEDLD